MELSELQSYKEVKDNYTVLYTVIFLFILLLGAQFLLYSRWSGEDRLNAGYYLLDIFCFLILPFIYAYWPRKGMKRFFGGRMWPRYYYNEQSKTRISVQVLWWSW